MNEIKKGMQFIDERGRKGIVTEVRDEGEDIFVRPQEHQTKIDDTEGITGVDNAIILTPTCWTRQQDGSYRGMWWDSKPNDFCNGNLEV